MNRILKTKERKPFEEFTKENETKYLKFSPEKNIENLKKNLKYFPIPKFSPADLDVINEKPQIDLMKALKRKKNIWHCYNKIYVYESFLCS